MKKRTKRPEAAKRDSEPVRGSKTPWQMGDPHDPLLTLLRDTYAHRICDTRPPRAEA